MLSLFRRYRQWQQPAQSRHRGVQHNPTSSSAPRTLSTDREYIESSSNDEKYGDNVLANPSVIATTHNVRYASSPPPPSLTLRRSVPDTLPIDEMSILDDYESDEEVIEVDDPHAPHEIQRERFCISHPDWSWAAEEPITHIKFLKVLYGRERLCKTTLERGLLGYRPVTFINRRWIRPSNVKEAGLYRELKLFTSDHALRPLQGVVVPKLINVYDDFESVSLLFEPPHHSFWMCASADMPYILKKLVVDAYYQLHQMGILHNSPELQNILIGGDCRVTLIDFSQARSKVPVPQIELKSPSRKDFELELREVMFKLDYEGARRREGAKMDRVIAQVKRNRSREKQRVLRENGIIDGPVEADEWPSPEDQSESPARPEIWNRWVESLDAPHVEQTVIPGQSPAQVAAAYEAFYARLKRLENLWKHEAVSPMLVRPTDFPLPLPLDHSIPDEITLENHRKRWMTCEGLNEPRPSKRARVDASAASHSMPYSSLYQYSSRSYSTGTSEVLFPAAPHSSSQPPPVKVRDFAFEPFDGPRGFYVPHPPTEYMMMASRVAHVINENAIQCGRLGLPYFREDNGKLLPPHYRRHHHKCLSTSLGILKRRRAAAEGTAPATREERQAAKWRQILEDRKAYLAEENRTVRFNDCITYAEYPQFIDDRRVTEPDCVWNQWNIPKRGVLKKTPPVRTVSYDLNSWLSTSKPPFGPTMELETMSAPPTHNSYPTRVRAEAEHNRSLIRQDFGDSLVDATTGSQDIQLLYGPHVVRPALDGQRSRDAQLAPSCLQTRTEDDLEKREVLDMLLETSSPVEDEDEGKSMLDNILIWLKRRDKPDGSDIWDE